MSSVSVIIPCYNYARYLRGCVRSVLDQPGVDVRVLVIDDCSKDETPQVGAALAGEDSRVEFRRHETNKGHIATYNEGIAWASDDYLLLLSADDLATTGALTRAAAVMDANPNVVMTHGKFFRLPGDSQPLPFTAPHQYKRDISTGRDFFEHLCRAGENLVSTPTVIVRTEIQKHVGGYNANLPHAGDLEMWLRFALHGDVAAIDVEQAHYRFHTSNMHLPFLRNAIRDMEQRWLTFTNVFDTCGSQITNLPRMRQLAAQGVARHAFWFAANAFDDGHPQQCDELLDFALRVDPQLAQSKDYARLMWKRRVGAKAWGVVMPVLRQLRGTTGQRAALPARTNA